MLQAVQKEHQPAWAFVLALSETQTRAHNHKGCVLERTLATSMHPMHTRALAFTGAKPSYRSLALLQTSKQLHIVCGSCAMELYSRKCCKHGDCQTGLLSDQLCQSHASSSTTLADVNLKSVHGTIVNLSSNVQMLEAFRVPKET